MKKIAVMISGGGTNLQSLIDRIHLKHAEIDLVISNRKNAYGLERAAAAGIDTMCVSCKQYPDDEEFDGIIVEELIKRDIELVVLAGYLKILTKSFLQKYRDRIINIHPSLIPSFCGEGFYGERVHRSVFEKGVKVTGATTHFVSEEVDGGHIIMQEAVAINENDGVEDIAHKVLEIEHRVLSETVRAYLEDRIVIKNNRAFVREGK